MVIKVPDWRKEQATEMFRVMQMDYAEVSAWVKTKTEHDASNNVYAFVIGYFKYTVKDLGDSIEES